MVVFRSLEQPPADPALVGGCVLPVLSFNTKEEELAMRVASGEEQCRTAARILKGFG